MHTIFSSIRSTAAIIGALIATAVRPDKPRDDDDYWNSPSEFAAHAS